MVGLIFSYIRIYSCLIYGYPHFFVFLFFCKPGHPAALVKEQFSNGIDFVASIGINFVKAAFGITVKSICGSVP
jgi:hypothetical protein